MPLSEIIQALVRRGVITRDAGVEAERRRNLYGGGIDTVLLELRATDEATLLSHLAEILGIPLAPTTATYELPPAAEKGEQWIDGPTAQRLGAVPVARHADALDVLVRPEHDHDLLVDWAEQHALLIEPMLISEARFRGLLRAIYDIPVPPRYLALLAKLVGTATARAVAGDRGRPERQTPSPVLADVDPIETLLAAARLGDTPSRHAALRLLARRPSSPRVNALRLDLERKAEHSPPTVAVAALRALAELRDKNSVPALVQVLQAENEDVATAAQAALVALTSEDLGRKPKRWLDWWSRMGHRSRVEWLLDGLAHRTPELRLLASNELYEISGEYFGYHYDLPERDREEARQRWMLWWQSKPGAPGAK
jgi:hypothetical protein